MNDRAWEDLIDTIDQRFGIDKVERATKPLPDEPKLTAEHEMVLFTRNGKQYRIDRVTAPALIDRKTYYHQTGQASRVQNVYDSTESSKKVHFYEQTDTEWVEIAPEQLLS